MTIRRPVLALCALVGLSLPASAEPIQFSYTATGTVSPGPIGSSSPGKITLSLDTQGNVQVPPAGGTVSLGSLDFGWSKPHAGYATSDFQVTIGLWDQASATAGSLALTGTAVDSWFFPPGGPAFNDHHALTFNDGFDPGYGGYTAVTQTIVGNTLYTLTAEVRADRTHAEFELSAAAATPEPGTLALVGCGLPMVGLWLRRRRG